MKQNLQITLFLGLLVILLTGCDPCTEQMTKDFKPDLLEPIDLEIVDDLRPELKWN